MEPLSPRIGQLPKYREDLNPTSAREKAVLFETLAKQCDADQDLDAYEACLREAHNLWLDVDDVKDKVRFAAIERILNQLGMHHKANTSPSEGLRFFERCAAVEESMLKKIGGLGNPQTLIHLSESLSACGRAEEALDVSKRAVDLLFRRYAHCNNLPDELPPDECAMFGHAWHSLAMAEECLIPSCSGEEEQSLKAVEALVHYRRGVKCARELLQSDDPTIAAMERRYNASKKSLGRLAAAAPKDRMPPAVAAYPTDKSAPRMSDIPAVSSGSSPGAAMPALRTSKSGRTGTHSAARSPGSNGGRTQSQPSVSDSGSTRLRSASRTRSSSMAGDRSVSRSGDDPLMSVRASPRQTVASARLSQGLPVEVVTLQRKNTITRLEPLNGSSPMSARRPSKSLDQSTPSFRHQPLAHSTETPQPAPPRRREKIVLANVKRGLQIVFHAAVSKKRSFPALRSVYMYVREQHTSFPHFSLLGERTLYEGIRAQDHRLDAMEHGRDHTAIEAEVAQKIRRRRSIDDIHRKRRENEEIVLFGDMDKRTERNARRYKTMMQAVSAFMQNMDRSIIRNAYRKWQAFLGPRRRMRPMRRAAAHLMKQVDRQMLRRRFITWLRWLKEKKRTVFTMSRKRSNAQNDSIQRSLQLISDQEVENEAAREKEKRIKEEELAYERHRSKLEAMQAEILEVIAAAESSKAEPEEEVPELSISAFVDAQVRQFMIKVNAAIEDDNSIEAADSAKVEFVEALNEYVTTEDYQIELRLLPCQEDAMRELTSRLSPLMISLVMEEELHSDANASMCRRILQILYPWVDFHHIFFEDDVLLSAARSGSCDYVELLLDGVPGFTISACGQYVTDLMDICIMHETKAVQLTEILILKCEGVIPFHEVQSIASLKMLQFFDRWVPSLARSHSKRNSLYDSEVDFSIRARVMTLFERVLLDVRSFAIPHDRELTDKQTLLSRMCANGDSELVELYNTLVDDGVWRMLLQQRLSDGTTCLIQSIKSTNSLLVRFLLEGYGDDIKDQLLDSYNGQTVHDICETRGCGDDMVQLLKSFGLQDLEASEVPTASRPSSQSSRMSNLFGKSIDSERHVEYHDGDDQEELDDIDDLFDDAGANSSGVISFSSPHAPDAENDSFRRFGL